MTQASLLLVPLCVTSSYSVPAGSHAANTDDNDNNKEGGGNREKVYASVVQRRCGPQADLGLGLSSTVCKYLVKSLTLHWPSVSSFLK